jgi:large-conductance mechanosensitive channel
MAQNKTRKATPRGKAAAGAVEAEIGNTGLPSVGGRIQDEFLVELRGERGRRVYREMADNDDAVGAILLAIEMMIRSVQYRFDPIDQSSAAMEARDWMQAAIFDDMSHTFEEFITEALSFLVYGWAYFEIVLKFRNGENKEDKEKSSKFDDKAIGIAKVAMRGQQSLDRWEFKEGRLTGMWQRAMLGNAMCFVPIERSMLLRTKKIMDNPEGRSILRSAYRAYYYKKNIQNQEAIGFERDLTGIPVAYIPSEILSATTGKASQARAVYEQIVRDVKMNEHGGIILPSDPYANDDGSYTSTPKFKLELLSSPGNKAVDADKVIRRYESSIARTVLADFIMLGNGHGSFALSKSKTDLFLTSLEAFKKIIITGFQKHVVETLWEVNGFAKELCPYLCGSNVAPVDLAELGDFISKTSGAGFMYAGDADTENFVRAAAGLPENAEANMAARPPADDAAP